MVLSHQINLHNLKNHENIKSRLENATKYNQQMIDILSELEKSEDVDLTSEIKHIKRRITKLMIVYVQLIN